MFPLHFLSQCLHLSPRPELENFRGTRAGGGVSLPPPADVSVQNNATARQFFSLVFLLYAYIYCTLRANKKKTFTLPRFTLMIVLVHPCDLIWCLQMVSATYWSRFCTVHTSSISNVQKSCLYPFNTSDKWATDETQTKNIEPEYTNFVISLDLDASNYCVDELQ